MIRHPFTLDHLAAALAARVSGATLIEAYTQEKFTVTLRFARDNETFAVLASVEPTYGTITLLNDAHRARRNTIDVFPALHGQRVATVTRHPSDRIVSFWFESAQLHVLLYGGATGNILMTRDGAVVDALREKQSLVNKPFTIPEFTPRLGPHYEALAATGIDVEAACANTTEYYVLERDGQPLFSLMPLPGWTLTQSTPNIFAALRSIISIRRKTSIVSLARTATLKRLERERSKLARGIEGMQSDAAQTDRASLYRMYGDLLLSLPNPTATAEHSITLTDWNGVEHTIALDHLKSYAKNADAYYTRARKSEKAADDRRRRLPQYVESLKRVDVQLERIKAATTLEDAEALLDKPMDKKTEPATPQQKYRTFELDDAYTLYVGRNAANNDELTMRFAKQNDWWFHARGVSGSHAVLRGGEGAEKPPKKILERAAAIAAYYSQARNASFVPVIYTQRKNVRKPKGANVGAVTLEREEMLMVKPESPASGDV